MDAPMSPPLRAVRFADLPVETWRSPDGVAYIRPRRPLGPYPARVTDALIRWAEAAPERIFLAERDATLVAIALERFRLKHGQYPAVLE